MPGKNIQFQILGSEWATHEFSRGELTLPQQDMADRRVDVIVDWVSAVDHQAVYELHGLGSLTPQLAGHHNLAAFSTALHDEPQNTIARPAT